MQAALKQKQKIDLLTDINVLLMVENGIRGGICHSWKANNKYMKDYDKNKESLYLWYWNVKNLYVWAMSQMVPVNNFEWIKDTFRKNYNEESH